MPRSLKFRPAPRVDLTIDLILEWADAFKDRTGRWPVRTDGPIGHTPETWSIVDSALKNGCRGLSPGSTLARLLLAHRGRRHKGHLPHLTETAILAWADAHHARTGEWPDQDAGPVTDAADETWSGVNAALGVGGRGLPGDSSLAQLLAAERGVRNHMTLPPLTPERVLAWADAHHARTGHWPSRDAGPIDGVADETWAAVHSALTKGLRGLAGGSSLAQLLMSRRGVRSAAHAPPLTREQILAWADAHHARTGKWPTTASGEVVGAAGEKWSAVNAALHAGKRGLPGGNSLVRLLAAERGARNHLALTPLTCEQILAWADAHHARTGRWPSVKSGRLSDAPGENWAALDTALRVGARGLAGGDSLARLLKWHRRTGSADATPSAG